MATYTANKKKYSKEDITKHSKQDPNWFVVDEPNGDISIRHKHTNKLITLFKKEK